MEPVTIIEPEKVPDDLKNHWVILWDGECGFCRRSVVWVLSQDKNGIIKAAPFQEQLAWLPPVISKASNEQVHLLSPKGEFWGGSEAARRTLELVNYRKLSAFLGLPGARLLNHWGYRLVARNRLFFSKLIFRK